MGTVAAALERAARQRVPSCGPAPRSCARPYRTASTFDWPTARSIAAGRCWPTARRRRWPACCGEPCADRRAPRSRSTSCSAGCRAFRSGIDPATGFAGTLHLHQGYHQLERAYADGDGRTDPRSAALRELLPLADRPVDRGSGAAGPGFPHADDLRTAHTGPALRHDHDRYGSRLLQAALALAAVGAGRAPDRLHRPRCPRRPVHRGDEPAGRRAGSAAARRPDLPRRPGLALAGRRRGAGHRGRAVGGGDRSTRRSCCADRGPGAAVPSAGSAATTRRWRCWRSWAWT